MKEVVVTVQGKQRVTFLIQISAAIDTKKIVSALSVLGEREEL